MKHIGTKTIKTTRLILRKLELTDAEMMFRNTDIERIDAFSSVENPASRKVMEKVGMHYVGLLRHYYKTRDGFHDSILKSRLS